MSPVTVAGMVMGILLILVAIAVFWSRKDFPPGGVAITVVGVVLIGMSQWNSIKIDAGGVSIDLTTIKTQIQQTATAVDQVAEQAERTAAAAETTRQQLVALTGQLGAKRVLTPAALQPIHTSLNAVPRVDVTRLRTARENMRRITKP